MAEAPIQPHIQSSEQQAWNPPEPKPINEATALSPPLHRACRARNFELVKSLLAAKHDVNQPAKTGALPIHIPCHRPGPSSTTNNLIPPVWTNAVLVQILLESQAAVDIPDTIHRLPIHIAVENDQLDVVRKLLTAGSPVLTQNGDGPNSRTPHEIARKFASAAVSDLLDAAASSDSAGEPRSIGDRVLVPVFPTSDFDGDWIRQVSLMALPDWPIRWLAH